MKICPNCNMLFQNEDNSSNFCPYCGKSYSDDTKQYKTCSKCNASTLIIENEESVFCPFCGEKYDYPKLNNDEIDSYEVDYYENKKKYILGIALYFGIFYIASIVFSVIVSFIWMAVNNVQTIDIDSPLYDKYMNDVLAWSNFCLYVAGLASILPFTFKFLIKDFKELKKNPGLNFKWFGLGFLIMYAGIYTSAIIIELLSFNLEVSDSTNQKVIENIINSGGINLIIMFIITTIFAPIIEEIVFRKCLFGIFKKNTIKVVILSALIFAGIHIIPACLDMIPFIFTGDKKITDLYLEFIYIFQYLGQAFALAFVYHKTKGNLIPCIMIHFINNFTSFLGTILLY